MGDFVEGRCACGCGTEITGASPSVWFASEACSLAWHRPPSAAEVLRRLFAGVAEALRSLAEWLAEQMEVFARLVPRVLQLAADVTARRRRRWPRPPARIDPGGGLVTAPRGRPAYRPRC